MFNELPNDYKNYILCENECLGLVSLIAASECQKNCALLYIQQISLAYQQPFFALSQSVLTESRCNIECLEANANNETLCCLPFNAEAIQVIRECGSECNFHGELSLVDCVSECYAKIDLEAAYNLSS
mmetsp:Transcript_3604/g.2653  ORF Transcript_3604/g.2653 Transcript_3604/m.2653 type:complete len:128 (+) Transcript_3604:369-752(+)|eukprot:CAMPEP_0202965174 /NCGR_PEP_ID=MMETSP1396-20130829/9240_1 /ASSEMBLY_ACC=CAM_ASM_000872 /TAXON_ID= /ORGANISM="Pseudokeronopsis sp., Strain Brazil" /LENGTH=127 /DNA_ID=CAMNT_0049687807 /DNA_START=369 /DNA_END=752 /DNA_ORIENTATION=-